MLGSVASGTPYIKQDTQCTWNVAMRRVRVTTVAVVKRQELYISSALALVDKHAMRMRHIASSVACLAPPRSYTLFHERLDYLGGGRIY